MWAREFTQTAIDDNNKHQILSTQEIALIAHWQLQEASLTKGYGDYERLHVNITFFIPSNLRTELPDLVRNFVIW